MIIRFLRPDGYRNHQAMVLTRTRVSPTTLATANFKYTIVNDGIRLGLKR